MNEQKGGNTNIFSPFFFSKEEICGIINLIVRFLTIKYRIYQVYVVKMSNIYIEVFIDKKCNLKGAPYGKTEYL